MSITEHNFINSIKPMYDLAVKHAEEVRKKELQKEDQGGGGGGGFDDDDVGFGMDVMQAGDDGADEDHSKKKRRKRSYMSLKSIQTLGGKTFDKCCPRASIHCALYRPHGRARIFVRSRTQLCRGLSYGSFKEYQSRSDHEQRYKIFGTGTDLTDSCIDRVTMDIQSRVLVP